MPPLHFLPHPQKLTPATFKALQNHLSQPYPKPLHLPKIIAQWPALTQWKLDDDLRRLRGGIGDDRVVEVELGPKGRGYLAKDYRRVNMGFGLFLDAFIFNKIPSNSPSTLNISAYLAQYDLPTSSTARSLNASNALEEDIPILDIFNSGPKGEIWRRTLWIGPKGTFTPFHKDPYIGIYSHLIGEKRFFIFPPSASKYLDISQSPPHTNTSTFPISVSSIFSSSIHSLDHQSAIEEKSAMTPNDDTAEYNAIDSKSIGHYQNQLDQAFKEDGACQIDLKPGESVLIPEGWWHSAEGLSVGVGVNAWFR